MLECAGGGKREGRMVIGMPTTIDEDEPSLLTSIDRRLPGPLNTMTITAF